jgi:hypothetical protein
MILPVVIQAAVWMRQDPATSYKGCILLLYAVINVGAVVSTYTLYFHSYVWLPYALLITYVLLKTHVVSNGDGKLEQRAAPCHDQHS